MSKMALVGSLAAALLVSGCVASGPALMPGWWVMLDSPEEEQPQAECTTTDCSGAKTTEEKPGAEEGTDEDSSQSEQAR